MHRRTIQQQLPYHLILLLLLLSSCATTKHTNIAQNDASNAAWKKSIEQRLDRVSRITQKSAMMQVERDMSSLDTERDIENLNLRLEALEKKIQALQMVSQKTATPQNKSTARAKKIVPPAIVIPVAATPAPSSSIKPNKPQPRKPSKLSKARAKKAYYAAYFALKKGNYFEASLAFRNFIRDFPHAKLIGEAKYWYAEALLSNGEKKPALLAFQKIIHDGSSSTPHIAAALLKSGYLYEELGNHNKANSSYNQLILHYPASLEAEQARKRLRH